jgi:uncharacterized protein YciI
MEFLYTLKLISRLQKVDAWTKEDETIVATHFNNLKKLTEEGIVVLAGRTLREDPGDFGIVILDVEDEEEARKLMETDPAVEQGIMTAKLYPFRVALIMDQPTQ